jgi:hypothetical protein
MSEPKVVQVTRIWRPPSVHSFTAALVMVAALSAAIGGRQIAGADEPTGLASIEGDGSSILSAPSVDQLVDSADVIAVGTVTAIDGPELVAHADPPDVPGPIRIYRITYRVDAILRGAVESELVVVDGEARGIPLFSARISDSQLVFVGRGRFGLTPVYDGGQSVFGITARGTAVNQRGQSIDLADLKRRLAVDTN